MTIQAQSKMYSFELNLKWCWPGPPTVLEFDQQTKCLPVISSTAKLLALECVVIEWSTC